MSVEIQDNTDDVFRDLEVAIENGLDRAANRWVSRAKKNVGPGGPPSGSDGSDVSPPGGFPSRRTGELHRSISHSGLVGNATKGERDLGTTLDPAKSHVFIQEYGGRISAKKARALTIPIGQLGRKLRRQIGDQSLRVLDLVFAKGKGKEPVLLHEGKPAFALRKFVTIPARPFMRPAYRSERAKMAQDFADAVSEGVSK